MEQFEQLSLFDPPKPEYSKDKMKKIGDKVARVVLGECYVGTITAIEGSFYRTSQGCYTYEEGLEDVETLIKKAEEERKKYDTIIPHDLERRITVEYPNPDSKSNRIDWGQVGVFKGMVFWKGRCTYQFLYKPKDEKDLEKIYKKCKKSMLSPYIPYTFCQEEKVMNRLYASKAAPGYADAEYVDFNF